MAAGLLEFIDLDSVIVAGSGNPIADLAALGHGLMNAALAAMTALMGAAAGSGLLESVPFVGKGLDMFESVWQVSDAFVSTVLGILLIAGAVLAYLLPALPFIRFLFAILGWVINVAVAVLAITVFAAAHVTRGDGNRLATQATRVGWLFLPALILRPPLMLFGLIAGYFVFLAGIGLFNEVWLPQMRDAGASGGLGPIGFLAMLTLYVMIAYGLMNASFKLIDVLPSAVSTGSAGAAARATRAATVSAAPPPAPSRGWAVCGSAHGPGPAAAVLPGAGNDSRHYTPSERNLNHDAIPADLRLRPAARRRRRLGSLSAGGGPPRRTLYHRARRRSGACPGGLYGHRPQGEGRLDPLRALRRGINHLRRNDLGGDCPARAWSPLLRGPYCATSGN